MSFRLLLQQEFVFWRNQIKSLYISFVNREYLLSNNDMWIARSRHHDVIEKFPTELVLLRGLLLKAVSAVPEIDLLVTS